MLQFMYESKGSLIKMNLRKVEFVRSLAFCSLMKAKRCEDERKSGAAEQYRFGRNERKKEKETHSFVTS